MGLSFSKATPDEVSVRVMSYDYLFRLDWAFPNDSYFAVRTHGVEKIVKVKACKVNLHWPKRLENTHSLFPVLRELVDDQMSRPVQFSNRGLIKKSS